MSIRNIDKGFVYAPTHIQIPYTGAANGTIDLYYVVMGSLVILDLPRITFTAQVVDYLYFKLPPDCCLSSSSRQILIYSYHSYNNTHPSGGVVRIIIATGDETMYGDTILATFNPACTLFDINDQQITYILA